MNVQRARLFRLGAEAAWVVGGQVATFLGGFALIKMLTGQLGPAAYGQLALGISAAGILHMFIYGPIEQMALRFVSVFRERNQLGVFLLVLRDIHVRAGIAAVAGAISAAAATQIFDLPAWAALMFSGLLFGLVGGVNATLLSLQSALRQRAAVAISQAGDVWLRLLVATAGLMFFDATASVTLFSFFAATTLIASIQLLRIWTIREIKSSFAGQDVISGNERAQSMREMLTYGKPYLAFAAFAWISTYSDRWIILSILDEHAVGIYAALFQIANAPIALLLGMTNQFLVPMIFERAGGATTQHQILQSGKLLQLAAAFYVFVIAVVLAAAWIFAKPLILLITNVEFVAESGLLWIICAGLGLSSLGQLLTVKGLSLNQPSRYVLPKFIQVVMLLAATMLLVPRWGLTGVALALCISGAAYVIAVAISNRHLNAPAN